MMHGPIYITAQLVIIHTDNISFCILGALYITPLDSLSNTWVSTGFTK